MPALRSFFQIWSLRSTLKPFVQFDRHRREEMPFIDSIQQVFTENNASRISGRPDPDSRHDSADSVDNLRGNALGFFRAGLGFFEPGIKLSQVLFRRSLRRFAAAIGHRVRSPILSLLGGCHIKILAEGSDAWKDSFHAKRKRPIMFP